MWNLEEAVAYYKKQGAPSDQSALVSLLRETQRENGNAIPKGLLTAMAEGLCVKESYLLAIVKRIPSLRISDTHCLELCGGPNCGKRAELAAFVEKNYGAKPKKFELKYVPCMRMCGKGPNIRWDGKIYHGADETLIRRLVEE
jgi:NADH:ubiquinone oxidoreductase subunit E